MIHIEPGTPTLTSLSILPNVFIIVTSGSAKSKTKLLEHQITELRHQIRELKNKNEYLSRIADRTQQNSKANRYVSQQLEIQQT